jgi:hypothetical protein
MTPSLNNRGIPTVGLYDGPKQYRRSVPVLVAEAWITNEYGDHFDTPIHLNGDRLDCHVDNLVWRPRWFAIEFHKTIVEDQFPNWSPDYSIELVDTHEIFAKPLPCAMKYGLLQMDILIGLLDQRPVFPGGLEFRQIH